MKSQPFLSLREHKVQDTFNELLTILIRGRMDSGFRSNSFEFDEDVNMYLAQLLYNHLDPAYLAEKGRYVHLYESDLIALQEGDLDFRKRYNLYKYTADHILFTLGIMGNIHRKSKMANNAFRLSNDVYEGRARAYYMYAASYIQKLRGKNSGVAETLVKIADNFLIYQDVLATIRGKYLNIVENFSDGEWFHFVYKNVIHREGIDSEVYVKLMDEFLLHLSAWKKSHDQRDKDLLRILGAELKRLNPAFSCNIEPVLSMQNAA